MGTDVLRVQSNERVDLNDWNFQADEALQLQTRQNLNQFMTNPAGQAAWILDGFEPVEVGGVVTVTKGRAIIGQREGSAVHQGVLATEGEATRVVDTAAFSDATYNVYIRFEYVDADDESRIFWTPASSGSEFVSVIATRRQANWSMRIETGSPGAEWFSIGSFVKTGGTIPAGMVDERLFYFEGDVDNSYESGWSTMAES